MRINARKLLGIPTAVLWKNLVGNFILVFDDGELRTNSKETIFSHYTWELHRIYGNTPLLMKHHVRTILNDGTLASNTHIKLLASVVWDCYLYHKSVGIKLDIDGLAQIVYRITNEMYNSLSCELEEYVVSMDIVDVLEILQDPEVNEVLSSSNTNERYIERSYQVLKDILNSNTKLSHNTIVKANKAKLIKQAQVLQCLGPRGFLTDIDSNIFDIPVLRGYAKGIRKLHDSFIESRSASKSLYFSKSELEEAEYFSRRLQILCQIVKDLEYGDCGSTNYLRWRVKKGELKNLLGKHYLDKNSNTLKTITADDKHLEDGDYVLLRSPVAGCCSPNPYGICSTCFGDLAYSVPPNTNIGQLCATDLTRQTSQNILSTKHLDKSSELERIILPDNYRETLSVTTNGRGYLLNERLKGKHLQITILQKEALGLTDIHDITDIRELGLTRVSEITEISITVRDNIQEYKTPFVVKYGKTPANLTYDILSFIKVKGWEIDEKNNYVFDMTDWDFSKPILSLPAIHFNMSDVTQEIARIIELNKEKETQSISPEVTLAELFEKVNKHLSVNLATLEVIIFGACVRSNTDKDFRLPKGNMHKEMGVSRNTIMNRSLASSMAYENHKAVLLDPISYFPEMRPAHPMDVFLCPKETLEN